MNEEIKEVLKKIKEVFIEAANLTIPIGQEIIRGADSAERFAFIANKLDEMINESGKKKTYAETKCNDIKCGKCPIRNLECCYGGKNTLQESLDRLKLDDEEREFYQKRINIEYKEE